MLQIWSVDYVLFLVEKKFFFFLSFGEEEDMVHRNLTKVKKKKKERVKRLLINSHDPIMRISLSLRDPWN